MKYTYLLILSLALASLACLESAAIPESAPSAASTPPPAERSPSTARQEEEIESGEVFPIESVATKSETVQCVTAIEAVHLRAEPSHKAIVINWLRHGQAVTVRYQAEGWTFAEANGQSGYIKSEFLGECER